MSATTKVSDLLTTGEVARLLGSSRQHVVDACTRGALPFVWVGSHRRIERLAVERLLGVTPEGLTREQERSLWLHRALLGRLMTDPDGVLGHAARNVDKFLALQSRENMTARWLREWARLLDAGVDEIAEAFTSRSSLALELRQNSPFAGALPQEERSRVLDAFARHWRRDHPDAPAGSSSSGPCAPVLAGA